VFLSPPEPSETSYSDTDSNNMLAAILTSRQLVRQVEGNVKCDSGSTVARATRLIARASDASPDDGVHFHSEFLVTVIAFTLGQVLNFGSLAYITDCYSELRPLCGTMPVDYAAPALYPLTGPPGANRQIHHGSATTQG
jgi:hypothetical protein